MREITEIGRSNIHLKDEPDQIRRGEGLVGDSNCHYILGLPIEHPMTECKVNIYESGVIGMIELIEMKQKGRLE